MIRGRILGKFAERLDSRIAAYRGAKAAARIEAPPELAWYYWTEFGTASRGEPGRASGHDYEIDPVNAEALRFPHNGEIVYRDHVDHPGIRPHRSIRNVLPEIRQQALRLMQEAFRSGATDNPKILSEAIANKSTGAIAEAKRLIVESMSTTLPGQREPEPESGRLHGQSAAEVFDEKTTIVNLSEA